MSKHRLTRIDLPDVDWNDLRASALLMGVPVPELLARLVRDFLRDPRRSPMVKRHTPRPPSTGVTLSKKRNR